MIIYQVLLGSVRGRIPIGFYLHRDKAEEVYNSLPSDATLSSNEIEEIHVNEDKVENK
jgi:hypothetical protein